MRRLILAAALTASIVPSAGWAKDPDKPVELSQADLAAVQTHAVDAPYEVLFPATMATLQQLNYNNVNASRDAGTATAQTEAKGKIIYNIIWGFGKKKRTQLASILMEPNGQAASKINLKLTTVESKSRGLIGSGFSDGVPVKVAEPYTAFYAALDAEVARRKGVIAAAAPAPNAAASVAPSPAAASAPQR